MIELKNEKLTVRIKEYGAEIASVKSADGHEYMWQGDAKFWTGQAPVLFPVCGKLLNLAYRHGGKTYSMNGHGFARRKTFSARQCGDAAAVFTLEDDAQTRAEYPFAFRLTVRYELDGDKIAVAVCVENTGTETMYCNFGSHEAYATDGNFADWSVEFEKEEDLRVYEQIGPAYLTGKILPFREKVKVLPLSYDLFASSSLAFDGIRSRAATLRRRGKPVVRVEFADFDQLLLWTKPGAPFFCIEPWNGIPDCIDTDGELSHKPRILSLDAGKEICARHTLQFFA